MGLIVAPPICISRKHRFGTESQRMFSATTGSTAHLQHAGVQEQVGGRETLEDRKHSLPEPAGPKLASDLKPFHPVPQHRGYLSSQLTAWRRPLFGRDDV